MNTDFWHHRWQTNEIAFHLEQANPLLVKHFSALNLPQDSRIFLPLCGKTNDIPWLISKGYKVAGAELSELAINQLFEELDVEPAISNIDNLKHYQAKGIDLFVGDIFELTSKTLGKVDAIFDRGALVALPIEMRHRYTRHLTAITSTAPQLIITYTYDQQSMEGPPFSVSKQELIQHYSNIYQQKFLAEEIVPGGLKGICSAKEQVWLLKAR